MSRIGKKPILIPDGTEVIIEGSVVVAKGPKGELKREIRPEIKVETDGREVKVSPRKETKKTGAFWGLTRALIFNMVKGVKDGFEKKLQIEGIGYKANLEGEDLILRVGFSHPVRINKEGNAKFAVEKNIIIISGPDKELVGQIAAKIKKIRPPEPYKGKGIRYLGETVRRKAGKKVVASGGA